MAKQRIIHRPVLLRGGKRKKRLLQRLILATTPQPPPAQVPNKDFFTLLAPRRRIRKGNREIYAHQRLARKAKQLALLELISGAIPTSVVMPEVEGIAYASAETILIANFLAVELDFIGSLSVPSGIVIQQSVKASVPIATGTVITLQVSSGAVSVPEVEGEDQGIAIPTLVAAGLLTRSTPQPTFAVLPGTVIKQTPPGGTKVLPGTTVSLIVATSPPAGAARAQLPSTGDIVTVTSQIVN